MKTVTCMLPSQFILTVVEIEKSGVKPTLHCWVFWYCQARDSAPTSASAHNFDKKYCVNIYFHCRVLLMGVTLRVAWNGDSETQRLRGDKLVLLDPGIESSETRGEHSA